MGWGLLCRDFFRSATTFSLFLKNLFSGKLGIAKPFFFNCLKEIRKNKGQIKATYLRMEFL
jgi:hypothetical protein